VIYAITGSGGFIGKALVNRLTADGHGVFPIEHSLLGSVALLAERLNACGANTVFHLAAYGNHYNQTEAKEILRSNVLYTLNVFKAADGRRVINFSTSSVLLSYRTLYSVSKRCGEELASLFPNIITVHPYSVYGPGEADHRFIPTVIQALKNGERITLDENATHDWIYITDLVDAVLNGHTELGTGEKRTNLEIVRKLEEISGKKLNYTPGALRSYDNSNWVCPNGVQHLSIEEGLLKTWIHYNK
jgi:nucleoside-diphosphate-sugar epimerase